MSHSGATNWEEPHFGYEDIKVCPKDNAFNPYTDKYVADQEDWKLYHPGVKQLIPAAEKRFEQCQHLDQCTGLKGNPKSGFLTLRMPRMELGRLYVCCSGKEAGGKKCGELFNSAKIGFLFDGQVQFQLICVINVAYLSVPCLLVTARNRRSKDPTQRRWAENVLR